MRILAASALVALTVGALGAGLASADAGSGAAKLRGTYARTVTQADIARTASFRREGPGENVPPTGRVKLVLSAGTFRFSDRTGFAIAQTYSATAGGKLAIEAYVNPSKGAFCGPEIPQNAAYRWSARGGTLTLKATSDRCADRNSVLVGRWRRVR
jgi:hypothetical protein